MSSNQRQPMSKFSSRLNSPKPSSSFSSQNKNDDLKLPILKRSGTYVVETPSPLVKNATSNNNLLSNQKPAIKPPNKPAQNRASQPSYPRQSSTTSNTSQEIEEAKSTKASVSLSMLKQQKRAEMLKLNSKKTNDNGADAPTGNNRSMDYIIKCARRSGQLNLSDHGLTEG